MKRLFIIHGWGGSPDEELHKYLKKELSKENFEVYFPEMPNTEEPKINEWVSHLKKTVQTPDKSTYFLGHSIGCQAILRYIESLPENTKVGGAIFLAGWFNLKNLESSEEEIAKPWLETPINCKKILTHCGKFTAIFSDNDPLVPLQDSKIFKEKLRAKIIIEKGKEHFNGQDGADEVPKLIDELIKLANNSN